jgi:hypothetical protein
MVDKQSVETVLELSDRGLNEDGGTEEKQENYEPSSSYLSSPPLSSSLPRTPSHEAAAPLQSVEHLTVSSVVRLEWPYLITT